MPHCHELDRLRSAIDSIDDQILTLVERRLDLARDIAAAKARRGGTGLKLSPRREAEIVERLALRGSTCSKTAIRHIWRELMGHSLQAQGRLDLVIADGELEQAARDVFGSAPHVVRVATAAEALDLASSSDAVAILPLPLPAIPAGLQIVRRIGGADGSPLAAAIGRVPADELAPAAEQRADWSPQSWRRHKASQMPIYADAEALAAAERQLAGSAPVVSVAEAITLKAELARAAAGQAFLLQAGDCAESFDAFGAEHLMRDADLLLKAGALLPIEVVHVARAAGQYGKPRSTGIEASEDGPIPTYRGDAVNGVACTRAARSPDPQRLIRAHALSSATAKLLDGLAGAAALSPSRAGRIYASHEALLLNYEQSLTRWDEASKRWWATSGHMVWIGERTRQLDGAHVEYARGIANPIGIKCGPTLEADELLRLIDRLDPENEAGRLTLIGRFGAEEIGRSLPSLMAATRSAGRNLLWVCDPMHGNGRQHGGYKTRLVEDIASEIRSCFEIAAAEGVHAGGVHLETTARDVVECLAIADLGSVRLGADYRTLCDPRLNAAQTLEIAGVVADCMNRRRVREARAA